MIKSLTKVHSVCIACAVLVAQQIVNTLNRRIARSNNRANKASSLKDQVVLNCKLIVEQQAALRKELNRQVVQANRLIYV